MHEAARAQGKKALFLVTELERPVGGLHRFATELLLSWRAAFHEGRTEYEPVVLSMHDPASPTVDLVAARQFAELTMQYPEAKIFEAVRGGEKCYFLEPNLSSDAINAFHGELYSKFRIRSDKASQDRFYRALSAFWKLAPLAADYMQSRLGLKFDVIDAQDWLAFPAGFLCRERLSKPLLCRFHSGECGRTLGRPDPDSAPLQIEAAALAFADYIQGVSVSEAKFEILNLLERKRQICLELAPQMPSDWAAKQQWKDGKYEEFLLLESESLELLGECAGGVPNGIVLEPWKSVHIADIYKGREMLRNIMPKRHYALFIGRAERRKGIYELLDAFALLRDVDVGLVLASRMGSAEYEDFSARIAHYGLQNSVALYNGWLSDNAKKSLMCAADIIALPSLYEPFGIVTLEALAADLACEANGIRGPVVIVGSNGGMNEVIRNGVNGFKAPIASEFSLRADHLAKIISMSVANEHLRARVSKGASERVQSPYFDWRFVTLRIHECYRRASRNFHSWFKPAPVAGERRESEWSASRNILEQKRA
jgi:glycosyltransferase involved in cell wall biosynthesis